MSAGLKEGTVPEAPSWIDDFENLDEQREDAVSMPDRCAAALFTVCQSFFSRLEIWKQAPVFTKEGVLPAADAMEGCRQLGSVLPSQLPG